MYHILTGIVAYCRGKAEDNWGLAETYKICVPDLGRYASSTGIGRVLDELMRSLRSQAVFSELEYKRSKLPIFRNLTKGLIALPKDADLILFPQITGSRALRDCSGYNTAVIVHDVGIIDSYEDRKSLDPISRWVIESDLRHLRHATSIITVSQFTKERLISNDPGLARIVQASHIGVSDVFHNLQIDRNTARKLTEQSLAVRFGQPLLLYVGTERPRKKFPLLLESFAILKRTYPNLTLLKLGGPGSDQDRSSTIREMESLKLTLGEDVILVDSVSDDLLAIAYRAADLYVSASVHEGFGLPYVEALAVGTRVVGVRTGVLTENLPGVRLVSPTPDSLSAGIAAELDKELLDGNDIPIREYIRKNFNWNRFSSDVMSLVYKGEKIT